MTHLNPDLRITHYRWGSDGTETGHGWLADEDTAYELPNGDLDSTFFLRVCVQENNGDNTNANTYQLQRNIDGAGAGDVTGASTGIRASASGNIADDAATSNRIGGTGTFVAGRFDEADGNTTTGVTLAQTEHTEILYSITARSADLSGGESIVLTLVSSNDLIDAHDVTITLNIGSPAADTTDEEFAATQAIGRNPPKRLDVAAANQREFFGDSEPIPESLKIHGTGALVVDDLPPAREVYDVARQRAGFGDIEVRQDPEIGEVVGSNALTDDDLPPRRKEVHTSLLPFFYADLFPILPEIYADSWFSQFAKPERAWSSHEMVGYGDGQPRRVPADAVVAGDPTLTMHLDFALNDGSTINAAIISGPSSLTFTRASDGTNFDEAGVLQTNTSNNPRYDHDPGAADAPLGILIEGAATNVCLQSDDFSTTWGSNGTPVLTVNDAVAPDGNTTADKIEDDNSGAVESKRQDVTISDDSTSWCYSIFVKKTSGDSHYAGLDCNLRNGSTQKLAGFIVINTNTGVISATEADVDDSGVIDAGDYWRVWGVISNNSSGNTTARLFVAPAYNTDGTSTAAASTTGFKHFWRAQLENTAYPTSPIATTTTSVTRVAESLSTTSVAWANSDFSGSWVTEAAATDGAEGSIGRNRIIHELSQNSSADQVALRYDNNSGNSQLLDFGGTLNASVAGPNDADMHKFGGAVAATNDAELYWDGASKKTDTSYTLTTDPDQFYIGLAEGGNQWFQGHIKNIRYWNERKDDTFMISETT